MPLLRYDSPSLLPISSSAWLLTTGVLTLLFQALGGLRGLLTSAVVNGTKTAEEFARKLSPAIDGLALIWVLDRSDEDLAGIPGFYRSKVLNDPMIRKQRLAICRGDERGILRISSQIFHRVINAEWDGLLSSVEFGIFLGKTDRSDPVTDYHSKAILSIILPRVQGRDECWFRLAADRLGCSMSDVKDYLRHGGSISLAASIHIFQNIIYAHFHPFGLGNATTRWKARFRRYSMTSATSGMRSPSWRATRIIAFDPFISQSSGMSAALTSFYIKYQFLPTEFSSSTADDDDVLVLSSYPLCNVSDHHLHLASRTD
ncbi:hypothetical protein EDB89DRAFT_2228029 [Lactarius sanguifluus]|nr:hypothetical protein EDB89DRAFT_2228029 [Lactarius sanguifluus]